VQDCADLMSLFVVYCLLLVCHVRDATQSM